MKGKGRGEAGDLHAKSKYYVGSHSLASTARENASMHGSDQRRDLGNSPLAPFAGNTGCFAIKDWVGNGQAMGRQWVGGQADMPW